MVAGRFRRHSHPIRFDPISFLPSLSSFLSIQANSTVKTVTMAVLLLFDRAACFFPLLFRIPIRLFLDLAQFHWSLRRTSSPPLPPPSGSHSRYVFFSSLLFDLWLGFKIHNSANKKRRDIKEHEGLCCRCRCPLCCRCGFSFFGDTSVPSVHLTCRPR
ncbi:unnamed protein product [Musa acuminata subsp. burmannicoides]